MKSFKWAAILALIVLGGCSNTAADNEPVTEQKPTEQNVGQGATQNVSQIVAPNSTQNATPNASQNVSQNVSKPTPTPPVKSLLVIKGVILAPEVVDVGHPAVIIVTVNNTDTKAATYPVQLLIDGIPYATQTVYLQGATGANVSFDFTPMLEHNVLISCGDITRELIIQHS